MDRSRLEAGADRATGAAEGVARSDWVERLGRVGLLGRAAVWAIVAVLALMVAFGVGGKTTDQQGALHTVARQPFGTALVILLAIALLAYGSWRAVQAITGRADDQDDGAKGTAKRLGHAAAAITYAALFVTAIALLTGSKSSGGGADSITRTVMEVTLGRWLVGIAGLVLVGVGLYAAYEGLSQKFMRNMRTAEMSEAEETLVRRTGMVGLVARGVVFGLIGVFVTKAAVEFDPDDAIGLDGALAKLARQDQGPILLGIVAAGLLCFALASAFAARYRRV